jgi:hypothetical protein
VHGGGPPYATSAPAPAPAAGITVVALIVHESLSRMAVAGAGGMGSAIMALFKSPTKPAGPRGGAATVANTGAAVTPGTSE